MAPRECPVGKILNPATGRCVDENGKIGRQLRGAVSTTTRECPPGKIINPATGRCVDENGKIGRQLRGVAASVPTVAQVAHHMSQLSLRSNARQPDAMRQTLESWSSKLHKDREVVDAAVCLARAHARRRNSSSVEPAVLAACLLLAYKLVGLQEHVPYVDSVAYVARVSRKAILDAESAVAKAADWRLMGIIRRCN